MSVITDEVSPDLEHALSVCEELGIRAVELRVDDGPWQPADLEPYDPALVWQRWRFDWHPEPGEHSLAVRAIDGTGAPQTEERREPHPDGMTGLHQIEVRVG